jgi:hypothetical protein
MKLVGFEPTTSAKLRGNSNQHHLQRKEMIRHQQRNKQSTIGLQFTKMIQKNNALRFENQWN